MRDPNRIYPMMERIAERWKTECPDWRFGQLIINFIRWYGDCFFVEDDRFEELFDRFLEDCFGRQKTEQFIKNRNSGKEGEVKG